MASWNIPELNGGVNRKITLHGPISIAMFDFPEGSYDMDYRLLMMHVS